MGLASFIFGREKFRTQLDSLVVDVTEILDTSLSASISDNPIEAKKNSSVTDHIVIDPLKLSISGYITESPSNDLLNNLESIAGGVTGGLLGQLGANSKIGGAGLIGTGLGAALGSRIPGALAGFQGERAEFYARAVMKDLMRIMREKKPFIIKTFFFPTDDQENNIYTNMVIESLNFPQTFREGRGLRFSLTARQLKLVSLETEAVSAEFVKDEQPANSSTKKQNIGKQGTEEASEKTEEKTSDLLDRSKDLFERSGNLFD